MGTLPGEMTTHSERLLRAHVFVDSKSGRGQSVLQLSNARPVFVQVEEAVAKAKQAVGMEWRLGPPAAPARVKLVDAKWQKNSEQMMQDLSQEITDTTSATGLSIVGGGVEVGRQRLRVVTSSGFDHEHERAEGGVSLQVRADEDATVDLRSRARRSVDLRLPQKCTEAHRHSLALATAEPTPSGPCDVLLMANAYQPRKAADLGIWAPLVSQALGEEVERGLTRYSLGQSILQTPPRGEALNMQSDGTLDYGLRSAPYDEQGQATRRFDMVKEGVATTRAETYRSAALSAARFTGHLGAGAASPNGGVGNLVVKPGRQDLATLRQANERPLLVVHHVQQLLSEPGGALTLHVGLGEWLEPGKGKSSFTRGGVLAGNLFTWLEECYFSKETVDELWYRGPTAIRFNSKQILVFPSLWSQGN
jgi:PmbA protein